MPRPETDTLLKEGGVKNEGGGPKDIHKDCAQVFGVETAFDTG